MKFLFVIIVISINFLNASSLNFAYTVEDVKKEFNSTCDTLKRVDFWDYDTGIKIPENYGVDDKREQQFLISILLNYANHDNFYNDKECGDILSGAIDHIIKLAINKQSEFAVFYILNSPVVNSQFRGFKDFHFFYYRNILFPIFMNYKNIDKHLSPNNFILKNYKDRICLYMNDNDTSSIINLAYTLKHAQ